MPHGELQREGSAEGVADHVRTAQPQFSNEPREDLGVVGNPEPLGRNR